MGDWPETRIGGLVFAGLWLVTVLSAFVLKWTWERRVRRELEEDARVQRVVSVRRYRFWPSWVYAVWEPRRRRHAPSSEPKSPSSSDTDGDSNSEDMSASSDEYGYDATSSDVSYGSASEQEERGRAGGLAVTLSQPSVCGLMDAVPVEVTRIYEADRVDELAQRRYPVTCGYVSWALVNALLAACAAHFVPCLWWTCDLGDGDNGRVRGLIWFLGTPVLFILLMLPWLRQWGVTVDGVWVPGGVLVTERDVLRPRTA